MPAAGRVAACPPSTALTALTKSVGSSSQGSAINSSGTPASVNSKAVARAKRPVPMITAGAAVGSACSRIASSRPRPCVRWPISRPSSWCSRRLQPPAKWAAGLTEATRLTAGCRSGPANRQPWKPMAEIPASASGSRSGTTSSVRKRQSSESRATTRSKRYCAGLPAAGWPKRAMTSCSAGLVMASFATPPGSRRRFFVTVGGCSCSQHPTAKGYTACSITATNRGSSRIGSKSGSTVVNARKRSSEEMAFVKNSIAARTLPANE